MTFGDYIKENANYTYVQKKSKELTRNNKIVFSGKRSVSFGSAMKYFFRALPCQTAKKISDV